MKSLHDLFAYQINYPGHKNIDSLDIHYCLAHEDGPEHITFTLRKCNATNALNAELKDLVYTGSHTSAYGLGFDIPIMTKASAIVSGDSSVELLKLQENDMVVFKTPGLQLPNNRIKDMLDVLMHNIHQATGVKKFGVVIVSDIGIISGVVDKTKDEAAAIDDKHTRMYNALIARGFGVVGHRGTNVFEVHLDKPPRSYGWKADTVIKDEDNLSPDFDIKYLDCRKQDGRWFASVYLELIDKHKKYTLSSERLAFELGILRDRGFADVEYNASNGQYMFELGHIMTAQAYGWRLQYPIKNLTGKHPEYLIVYKGMSGNRACITLSHMNFVTAKDLD